ncbi:MAG: ATP-binding protein [Pontimonas sp.]
MPSSAEYAITLVDGRSGAGKSHFAAELARSRDAVVVSIDDVYPGWDGLDAGSWLIHEYLVRPYLAGLTGRYRPWSWEEQRRGEWVEVSPDVPLIVEGCGAIRRDSVTTSSRLVWVETDDAVRRERALERDGQMFEPHWTRWALQEERFLALHHSRELATEIVNMG